jgi:SAM-dependent methyltransferase
MPSIPSVDDGKPFDWGKTSSDYSAFRPGYPDSFYALLDALDVGKPGQRILDLASGPGIVAVPLAKLGATVTALDIAENQIEAAREHAQSAGVHLDCIVAGAESTGLPSESYDLVVASMCMHYFDHGAVSAEISRLLAPGGRFLVCGLLYLPRESKIASASEDLILTHNPDWSAAGYSGEIPVVPGWSEGRFNLLSFHRYVEDLSFTRESWRGRIRACRGVGASLSGDRVEAFDKDHAELLERIAGPHFTVPHLIALHVFAPH